MFLIVLSESAPKRVDYLDTTHDCVRYGSFIKPATNLYRCIPGKCDPRSNNIWPYYGTAKAFLNEQNAFSIDACLVYISKFTFHGGLILLLICSNFCSIKYFVNPRKSALLLFWNFFFEFFRISFSKLVINPWNSGVIKKNEDTARKHVKFPAILRYLQVCI